MTQYYRPDSLTAALEHLQSPCRIIAGATDIYPSLAQSRAWGQPTGSAINGNWLDISAISELKGITQSDQHWRIGALVTWSDVAATRLPSGLAALQAAAREVGGAQIQNRATLVGNVCNASPAADGIPPLLCLDALVELISGRGRRQLPLEEFIVGNRKTRVAADEMVSALLLPTPLTTYRSDFYKLGARRYLVISIAMAAVALDVDPDGTIRDARVAVGACSEVASRIRKLEQKLCGASMSASLVKLVQATDFDHLQPIDDVRASAAYRHLAAVEVCRRLLGALTDSFNAA